MPMNCVAACTPPTVTITFWVGFGRLASGVPEAGAAPVETGGVTDPAPVMNSVPIFPRAADVVGTVAPVWSTKIPGAADARLKMRLVTRPFVLTLTLAREFSAVSYGI